MSDNERILANARANMELEGFIITKEDEEMGLECLEGKKSFEEMVIELKKLYTQGRKS